jgi:hypothetical protein
MNRRLRVAIQISTSTGDHRSSSTGAACKLFTGYSRQATARPKETEHVSRLFEWPRASMYTGQRPPIGWCQMTESRKSPRSVHACKAVTCRHHVECSSHRVMCFFPKRKAGSGRHRAPAVGTTQTLYQNLAVSVHALHFGSVRSFGRLPIPGQQFIEPSVRVTVGQALQHIVQIGERFDAVEPRRRDQ